MTHYIDDNHYHLKDILRYCLCIFFRQSYNSYTMAKPKTVVDANLALQEIMPQALLVLRETIYGIESRTDERDKQIGWSKQTLDTSIWLIEKITGKPKTEDASTGDGLIRQLLQIMNDRKNIPVSDLISKSKSFTKEESESSNSISSFVENFGDE